LREIRLIPYSGWTPTGSDKVWAKVEQKLPTADADVQTGKGWPLVDLYTAAASYEVSFAYGGTGF
jgi:hypothetical protein